MKLSVAPLWLLISALVASPLAAASVDGSFRLISGRGKAPSLTEAVVWLEPLGVNKPPIPAQRDLTMTTRSKVLIPHVMAVPVGSAVRFPNEDPITHNLFSVSASNPFDLGLYRRDEGRSKTFDKPGIVNVYCNVHPNMSAVLVVLDTPYWTQVRADGSWKIEAPPGRYRLHAWHEQGGTSVTELTVRADGTTTGSTDVTLDSSRFRGRTHLNKHGKPYPRVRDY